MRNIYKSVLGIALSAFFYLINLNESKASHAMGADITYQCLGNNQYRVTFSFYRDCFGIAAPATMSLNISSSCFPNQTVNLSPLPSSPTLITPLCPSALSTCNGGSFTGIQEWVYEGIITLPGPCADWTFSHSENARNAAITTISGAGSDDLFVYSVLNNTNGICDDSPIFSNRPVPFACVGQRFCFNHGAYDAQGDSLSYQIITPRSGPNASDTVGYLPGYSAGQPVISSPPMTFNPATGDFCMTPQQTDVTVLAILVSEWRNGVLIGQVERDIQVTVLNCSNILPSITGMNGAPFFTANVCAGNPICFYIASIDPDASNTTIITWDGSIPGASFTTTNGHRDSAYFCWTPTAADISQTPYCFTVTVSDDNCPYIGVQAYSFCITVRGVNPDAGPDQTVPCGVTANLSGSATGGNGVFTYTWFPDSVVSQNLNGVGIGTYVLEVTSAGCKNWDTVQVLAGAGVPTANFTFSNNCSGAPIQFTDNSVVNGATITSWSWDFGDGTGSNQQNPTHQYASNNTYSAVLTVSTASGCTSTITQQVVINTNIPSALFSANAVCEGSPMLLVDQTSGGQLTNWNWNFGDPASGAGNTSNAQNPSHTFSTSGTFHVTLDVTNSTGCSNQYSQDVFVNANPVINVSNAGMCEGAQATLNAPPGFSSYSWSNSSTSESITVSPLVSTNYTVTVTDANGCVGSTSAMVNVDPLPLPNAGADQTICEGTSANLGALGGTQYTWNPGNISGQNIVVSPSVTTTYTVTVSTNAGCSADDNVLITVNPMPTANAGDDLGICKGESITINSVAGAANILWTPGNFNTASITVTPLITTTYTLMVSDAIGCSGSDTITVVVNPLPTAAFANSGPVCLNSAITFTDNSNVASGNVANWNWDFGNGQNSNVQNPSVTYLSSNNFNVKLLVTTNAGCKDSVTNIAIVNPLPVANAGPDASICPGDNATLNGNGGVSYNWTPGGFNTASITQSPAVTTDYTLTVTDANGCVNTDVATIVVNPVPVANAGPDESICLGESLTLSASGGIDYLWSPGAINSQNYNITPVVSGVYSVLVTNAFGCQSTDQVTIQVNPIPTASFITSGAICEDNPVTFTDQSSVGTGSIVAWNWNFGNNMSSSNQNPTIPYSNPGNFDVSLVIYSDNGCSDTTHVMQTIWARPTANFTHTNVCDGNPISFSNVSSISDATPLNYSWNLGDSYTSTATDLSHQYATYGSYSASLVVTSVNGCIDTYNSQINVYPLPHANFSVDYSCEDEPAAFRDLSTIPTGIINSWFWTFGDNRTTTENNPLHVYDDPGDYDIHMRIASDHGCKDSTDGAIRVAPRPLVDFVSTNACLGYIVGLNDLSTAATGPIVQYVWNFGDGTTTTDQNPVHLYSAPGWYEVSLSATTDSGCTTTLIRPNALQVYAPPAPQFLNNATDANDIYPMVNFLNTTPNATYYYWSFGDGDTSTIFSPTHLYADIGSYDVQLIAVDMNGCIDSTLIRIEIRPTSNVYIPNAFTPNGDTKNDFFQVYSYNVKKMEVQIYDRWGLKIVEWDDVKGRWDGRVGGNPAQADTYVYRVATVDVNDKHEVFIGHVSLVR